MKSKRNIKVLIPRQNLFIQKFFGHKTMLRLHDETADFYFLQLYRFFYIHFDDLETQKSSKCPFYL